MSLMIPAPSRNTYALSGTANFNYNGTKLAGETWDVPAFDGYGVFFPYSYASFPINYTQGTDTGGNTTTLRGQSLSFSDGANQLTSRPFTINGGNYGFSYDLDGNMQGTAFIDNFLSNGYLAPTNTQAFTFDGFDRLLRVDNQTTTTAYQYMADGRRVSAAHNPDLAPTYFLYDGDQVIAEYLASGQVLHSYLWGATGLTARIDSQSQGSGGGQPSKSPSTQTVGQPAVLQYAYDPSGNRVGRHPYGFINDPVNNWLTISSTLYDAYGSLIANCDVNYGNQVEAGPAVTDPVGYKGQFGCYTDYDTGLVYCLHRYYSPQFGRWITRDPVGLEGGANVYEFCGNNPVMFSDPSGLDVFHLTTKQRAAVEMAIGIISRHQGQLGRQFASELRRTVREGLIQADTDLAAKPAAGETRWGTIYIDPKEIPDPSIFGKKRSVRQWSAEVLKVNLIVLSGYLVHENYHLNHQSTPNRFTVRRQEEDAWRTQVLYIAQVLVDGDFTARQRKDLEDYLASYKKHWMEFGGIRVYEDLAGGLGRRAFLDPIVRGLFIHVRHPAKSRVPPTEKPRPAR